MRRVLFQDLTANSKKKRSLSMREVFEEDGYAYTAVRKTIFRIMKKTCFKDSQTASQWVLQELKDPNQAKRLSVLRVYNRKRGENLWRSKLVGTFYIMRDKIVFTVLFLQVFRVEINRRN